jgi:DNA polymerase-1
VILYDKLGMPVLSKTAKGQPSTAEAVLDDLAEQGYPLPKVLMQYRSLSKLKSTYTDKLPGQINPRTGRIHTSYQQAVAATGRLSSSDPNLQNIPIRTAEGRRIRQAFVASPATSCWRRTIRRSSCASWPTWPRTKACCTPSATTWTCTAPPPPKCSAWRWKTSPPTSAAAPRRSTSA